MKGVFVNCGEERASKIVTQPRKFGAAENQVEKVSELVMPVHSRKYLYQYDPGLAETNGSS